MNDDHDDVNGVRFARRLLRGVDVTAVKQLHLGLANEARWAVAILSGGWSKLRELSILVCYETDGGLVNALPAVLTACAATLEVVSLKLFSAGCRLTEAEGGNPAAPAHRAAFSRALARCASLKRLEVPPSAVDARAPATSWLHANAAITDLTIGDCSLDDDPASGSHEALVAAGLISCATARGHLTSLTLGHMGPFGVDTHTIVAQALAAAMPLLTGLRLTRVSGA